MKRKKQEMALPYASFVLVLKNSYVNKRRKQRPDYPKLIIVVGSREKLKLARTLKPAEQLEALGLNKLKGFRRIAEEEGLEWHGTKAEAYRRAYERLVLFEEQRRKAAIHGERNAMNYRVYCFALQAEVWKLSKFRKANPHLAEPDAADPAFYVGQTAKGAEERYREHRDPAHPRHTQWGLKYFLTPFTAAFQTDLLNEFARDTGQQTSGLTLGQSIILEEDLSGWLRAKGYGAYSA
jgi:hypothetical protein